MHFEIMAPSILLRYGFGTFHGYVAENFAAQELATSGMRHLFSWNGRTSEIEFLLEKDGTVLPLEIKSGWITRSKSLTVYEEKYNPPCSLLAGASNFGKRERRVYIPLYAITSIRNLGYIKL